MREIHAVREVERGVRRMSWGCSQSQGPQESSRGTFGPNVPGPILSADPHRPQRCCQIILARTPREGG